MLILDEGIYFLWNFNPVVEYAHVRVEDGHIIALKMENGNPGEQYYLGEFPGYFPDQIPESYISHYDEA